MRKKWEEMSRAERRVAVAKDVIKAIHAGKVRAGHSGYVTPQQCDSDSGYKAIAPREGEDDKKWANRLLGESCTVCARGAMMLCKVAKHDGFDLSSLEMFHPWSSVGREHTNQALSDCFTVGQLRLIEECYEGWDEDRAWVENHRDPESRLIAIMQNIIDHGTLKPKVRYEVV